MSCACCPARRHARLRLLRCALAILPGDCWRELKALPAFKQLAQPLAASALAAASRDPVWVRREIGFRRVSVRAEAYREAGGRLTRQEQAEVRAHQRVRAHVAQQAAGAGGDGDGDGAVALTYEVTREDLEAAGMHGEGASMQWQLGQPANTEYEAGIEMWEAVGRFACPHLAAEIERQVRAGVAGAPAHALSCVQSPGDTPPGAAHVGKAPQAASTQADPERCLNNPKPPHHAPSRPLLGSATPWAVTTGTTTSRLQSWMRGCGRRWPERPAAATQTLRRCAAGRSWWCGRSGGSPRPS